MRSHRSKTEEKRRGAKRKEEKMPPPGVEESCVDEEEALAHLLHHLLDLTETELDIDVAQQPRQVVLAEVEHQVERGLVAAVLAADLKQVHNIFMI